MNLNLININNFVHDKKNLLKTAFLQVAPIIEDAGYTMIQLNEVEIVNEVNTILHIIHPKKLISLVEEMEENIRQADISNEALLLNEIKIFKAKIRTITPKEEGRKREA